MITGETILIAHFGYPTKTFKAPMIYNPYFDKVGVNAVVMPMGVKAEDYAEVLKAAFKLTNIRGALVTMPHKVTTVGLVDEVSTSARIAGSGGVGSAIAASLAATGVARLGLFDAFPASAEALGSRLQAHYPKL